MSYTYSADHIKHRATLCVFSHSNM